MKKRILAAGLLAIGATSVVAMDTQMIVGIEASSAKIDGKIGFTGTATVDGSDYSNLSADADDRDSALGLKVGVLLNKSHRLTANYASYSLDDDIDINTYAVNYDYLFKMKNKFTPFIGVHAGLVKAEFIGFSDDGMMYGVQVGTTYGIADNIEFEIGLSYSKLNATPKTPTVSGTYGNITLTNASAYVDAESMMKTYVGLNYKF